MTTDESILSFTDVVAGYGKRSVLNGISMNVCAGEIIAIIGHNGAGKSTLLKCAFGLIRPHSGKVWVCEKSTGDRSPAELLRNGVVYVPQGNRVFDDLTVRENLEIANNVNSDKQIPATLLDSVFSQFPILRDRLRQRAGTLSGGEKQMLAFAAAIMLRPRLLLIDEPSLGLGPKLVHSALDQIVDIRNRWGTAVLIVEQKIRDVLRISNRVYVLRNGVVSFSGPASALQDESTVREVYF